MSSNAKSSFKNDSINNDKKLNQYEYDLTIKQFQINELENLCDKLTIEIEDKELKIEEQDKEIQNLLELLKFANPELLKVYNGELTPY